MRDRTHLPLGLDLLLYQAGFGTSLVLVGVLILTVQIVGVEAPGVGLLLLVPAPLVDLGFRQAGDLGHPNNPFLVPSTFVAVELLFQQFQLSIALSLPLPKVLFVVDPRTLLSDLHELIVTVIVILLGDFELFGGVVQLHGSYGLREWADISRLGAQQLTEQILFRLPDVGRDKLQLPPLLGGGRALRIHPRMFFGFGEEQSLGFGVTVLLLHVNFKLQRILISNSLVDGFK